MNTRIDHTTIIEPTRGWRFVDFTELRRYRDLFYFLVWRDVKILYKQTVLGFLWAVVQPLTSMLIFTFVFGTMAKVSSEGLPYALFNIVALVPWIYFSNSLTASSQSLVTSANMITKIYFPRLIIPLGPVLAKLVDFFIALLVVPVLMIVYGVYPTASILLFPVLVLLLTMTAAGGGMLLTSLSIKYRDVKFIMTFLVQLLMYAAPVVWPASLVKQHYPSLWPWYGVYPMAGIIEGFRSVLLSRPVLWDLLAVSAGSSVLVLLAGVLYFRRTERIFADVA